MQVREMLIAKGLNPECLLESELKNEISSSRNEFTSRTSKKKRKVFNDLGLISNGPNLF